MQSVDPVSRNRGPTRPLYLLLQRSHLTPAQHTLLIQTSIQTAPKQSSFLVSPQHFYSRRSSGRFLSTRCFHPEFWPHWKLSRARKPATQVPVLTSPFGMTCCMSWFGEMVSSFQRSPVDFLPPLLAVFSGCSLSLVTIRKGLDKMTSPQSC